MFSLKYTTLVLVGTMIIISCSSLRQVSTVGQVTQNFGSPKDTSWSVAPLQDEDLQLLDSNPPKLWAGKPGLKFQPYVQTKISARQGTDADVSDGVIIKTSGYRVQIFAGREQDAAQGVKAAAESRFGIPTYLVYEVPQYKVRIGNFANRLQAADLLNSLKKDGYRDAWIVRSQIDIIR